MKIAITLAVLIALAPGAASAASNDAAAKDATASTTRDTPTKDAAKPKDCSTIKSMTVRQACLDRQAADRPGQQSGNMGDAVDKLKREDDLLAKKLKSICRGC